MLPVSFLSGDSSWTLFFKLFSYHARWGAAGFINNSIKSTRSLNLKIYIFRSTVLFYSKYIVLL